MNRLRLPELGGGLLMGAQGGGAAAEYYQGILDMFGANVVQYLPLGEAAGAVADDVSPNSYDGAYSGVTLANAASRFTGKTAPLFNAAGYIDIYSAGMAGKFNPLAGSMACYFKPQAAGVWTDSTVRGLIQLRVDASNRIYLRRGSTNNGIQFGYIAGGTTTPIKEQFPTPLASTIWRRALLTWDKAEDDVILYIDGAPITTLHGMGNWSGALSNAECLLGNLTKANNTNAWSGWMSDYLLLDRAMTPAEAQADYRYLRSALAFDGDSRTAAKTWPATAAAGIIDHCQLTNFGNAGDSVAAMIANAVSTVDAAIYGSKPICVVWGGVNDVDTNAAGIYARLQTYCLARRAAGWSVVVCTEIDAQDAARNAVDWHGTVYPALNTLLRNDHSFADGFADLGAAAELQDATNGTYFNADLVHLVAGGEAVVASVVAPVLAAL